MHKEGSKQIIMSFYSRNTDKPCTQEN